MNTVQFNWIHVYFSNGYHYFKRQIKTICTVSQNNQTKHKLFWQNPVKITERFRDWPKVYSAVRQAKNMSQVRRPGQHYLGYRWFYRKMLKVKHYYFVKTRTLYFKDFSLKSTIAEITLYVYWNSCKNNPFFLVILTESFLLSVWIMIPGITHKWDLNF